MDDNGKVHISAAEAKAIPEETLCGLDMDDVKHYVEVFDEDLDIYCSKCLEEIMGLVAGGIDDLRR